jgi:hypothetical protein
MLVEVLLDVEVGESVGIRNTEERLERSIGLDLMLVLETMLLYICRYTRSNLSTAHLRTSGLSKELAEVSRDVLGLLEDIGALGLGGVNLTLGPLALASLLDLLGHTLVKLAETSDHLRGLITETSYTLKSGTDVITDRCGRGGISRGSAHRRSYRSSNSGSRSGLGSLGLSGTGLLLSSRGSRSGSSYGGSGGRGISSLLYSTGLLGGFSVAHCVITGYNIIHLLTH